MTPSGSSNSGELYINARIEILSDVRLLSTIRGAVGNLTLEMGWEPSESRAITLAVDEAVTNKMRHAYGGRADGRIQIEILSVPGALVFRLIDQGEAPDKDRLFARERDSMAPGGFGTHIIRDVMDKVAYRTVDEGNELILTKYLPTRRQDPEISE